MGNLNQLYQQAYKENVEYVFEFLNRKLYNKDSDLARDLTQDTMLKVYKSIHRFDGNKSSMRTWIITIAKNVLIDYSRKRQLQTESINSFTDETNKEVLQPKTKSTPLTDLMNSQIGEGIQLAFSKLPDSSRKYAELFFNKQLTYDEIADELNQPLGTVKASIHRTRMLLREKLNFDLS